MEPNDCRLDAAQTADDPWGQPTAQQSMARPSAPQPGVSQAMITLAPADLISLLQGAGGGLANGNHVLSESMAAQSSLISSQTEQMKVLVAEIVACAKKLGEHERNSLDRIVERERNQLAFKQWEVLNATNQRQWEMRMGLAREEAAREKSTQKEMLGLMKTAAVGLLSAKNPEIGATLAAMAGMPIGAAAPGASEASGEAPGAGGLGQAVRMVVGQLSPETLDAIFAAAERPNPKIPNGAPTIAAVAGLLFTCFDADILGRVQADLGPEMFGKLMGAFNVM